MFKIKKYKQIYQKLIKSLIIPLINNWDKTSVKYINYFLFLFRINIKIENKKDRLYSIRNKNIDSKLTISRISRFDLYFLGIKNRMT